MKKLISIILASVLTLSLFPLNVVLGANNPANNPKIETRFQITSQWNGFFNAEIRVKNVSGSVIENWMLSFDFPHEITNIWSAQILSRKNNVYTLKNSGWNINIEAGAEISFGLTAAYTDKIIEPSNFKIIAETSPSLNSDYSIDFKILTDWGAGFSSQTIITNNSDKPIEAWKLKFDFAPEITNIWGAEIISRENGVYSISNLGYNSIIPPGQSVTIGFNGLPGNIAKPTNFILSHSGSDIIGVGSDSEAELYMKRMTLDNVVTDSATGIMYVRNQILLNARSGVAKTQIYDFVQQYGGDIVGYIEIADEFQIELKGEYTKDALLQIATELMQSELVELADLNFVAEYNTDVVTPNDPYCPVGSTSGDTDSWDIVDANGNKKNWGLLAVKAPAAWEYNNQLQPINIGVIDTKFYKHEDIEYTEVLNGSILNKTSNEDNILEPITLSNSHGTHVSGIIAATSNNGKGIAGMVWNKNLYVYSMTEPSYFIEVMEVKFAVAKMVTNDVKVINISQGWSQRINDGGNVDKNGKLINDDIKKMLSQEARQHEVFLKKLIFYGYDFVIVHSSGNESDKKTKVSTEIGGWFRNIKDNEVKSRIIVVAALQNNGYTLRSRFENFFNLGELDFKGYSITDFSQIDERVDILAPGKSIYSTIWGDVYAAADGTSMAAPFVTGAAAMVWAASPNLTGAQVKSILIDASRDRSVSDYPILNTQTALEMAVNATPQEGYRHEPKGILLGTVQPLNKDNIIEEDIHISVSKKTSYGSELVTSMTMTMADNASGKYDFTFGQYDFLLCEGTYSLLFYADGYLPVKIEESIGVGATYVEPIFLVADNANNNIIGFASGKITNAFDGIGINGVTLKFRPGWNIKYGNYIRLNENAVQIFTNVLGEYKIENDLPPGNYTLEASVDGFVTGYLNIIVSTPENITRNQNFMLTPILPDGQTRIVLSWGATPSDLDSHLTGPIQNSDTRFHIFYGNTSIQGVSLDHDDTTSYGPETITIANQIPGIYRYLIHDYTNRGNSASNALSSSGAQVTIYRGSNFVAKFNVPTNKNGTVWTVFEMNGDNIIPINTFSNESNPSMIRTLQITTVDDAVLLRNLPEKK